MNISVLTDNCAGTWTTAAHGLSYFIENDGKKILFDSGQNDLFLRNAVIMGVNMDNPDIIVLSHGHFDHGNGLGSLKGGILLCHPGCFAKRYRQKDGKPIGLNMAENELSSIFDLKTTDKPYRIADKIFFLGEIPRHTDFESKTTSFKFEDGSPDFVNDDSALAFVLSEGLFIITGCGHSGIVNTCEYAREVTGIKKLYGIMGGFHLKEIDIQTKETIKYLRNNTLKHIFPSHCTELPALTAFYEAFGIRQVRTGDILTF